jgi:hyperosmotically inducible protein
MAGLRPTKYPHTRRLSNLTAWIAEGIVSKSNQKAKWLIAVLPLVFSDSVALFSLASTNVCQGAQEPSTDPSPDNTKKNLPTNHLDANRADQQSNAPRDLELTRKIRRAVAHDKSLSTYGHNIKIITRNGIVQLKGPVRTQTEKDAIEVRATEIAGSSNVKNELTVRNP